MAPPIIKFRPRGLSGMSAFTMVEVLVVVAIVLVLITMVYPALNSMIDRSGLNIRCVSNMRNIGLAMQSYVMDNAGRLPGPLTDGQRLGYDKTQSDKYHIPRALGDYLGLPPALAKGQKQFAESIACLAWLKNLGPDGDKLSTPCYLISRPVIDGEKTRVFGNSDTDEPGMPYARIPSPAITVALRDADALLAPNYAGRMPGKPVHGAHRNTLFFDWHVEAVPVTP